MKLSEVIAEIEQLSDKAYVNDGLRIQRLGLMVQLIREPDGEDTGETISLCLDRNWIVAPTLVQWHDAIGAWGRGRKILCIHKGITYEYLTHGGLRSTDHNPPTAQMIAEGKWYILN